jgi:hypothetical protein
MDGGNAVAKLVIYPRKTTAYDDAVFESDHGADYPIGIRIPGMQCSICIDPGKSVAYLISHPGKSTTDIPSTSTIGYGGEHITIGTDEI